MLTRSSHTTTAIGAGKLSFITRGWHIDPNYILKLNMITLYQNQGHQPRVCACKYSIYLCHAY